MPYMYSAWHFISRFNLFLMYYCAATLHVIVFPLNTIFFNEYTSDDL